jgi:hypothetical protein
MIIFINGKQKRVKRPQIINGMYVDTSRTIQMNEYCPADDTDKNILEKIQGEINAFHGNKR